MLPTLGAPSKKSTPEQQMAMMRTYLNQLKDDTEGELYNIRWENLAKPLQDKLNGLDKDIVAQGEQFDYLNANMVSVGYLQANYLTASQIASNYIATANLEAAVINAGFIKASTVSANYVAADDLYVNTGQAKQFKSDFLYAGNISASQITTGIINSDRINSSSIKANVITSVISSADSAYFSRLNIDSNGMYIRTGNGMYKLTVRSVDSGGNTIYFLGTSTRPD